MSGSDSDEDNNIRYGTPLEPYEEDEVPSKRKYQQAPDQYAVDAHGRRRFHGAFTGGFSAGFGNTVGTPEGWTPSNFKSSRAEKAMFSGQRPEDFMDEEDRGEFGIAPRQLHTRSEFSGQKRHHPTQYHDGPIPGEPVLQQLVRAVHETAAVRMLRAMGWKEGQGTGERLTAKDKKKAKEQHKVYGCYVPPEFRQNTQDQEEQETEATSDASSDSEFDFETLFAPDDYEPYILNRKNDRFGLGYSGLSRHSVLGNMMGEYGESSSKSHLVMKDKGRKVSIRGQAFGVGAFEADDDDIYATEDMSHYDFAIGGPKEKKPEKKVTQKSGNVLEGFVKATKPLPSVPSYPAPALPRDYVPAVNTTRFDSTTHKQRDQGLGRHELTAKARGDLLGETPLPDPKPTPVSTAQTEDPIAKLLGRNVNFITTIDNNENKKELDYISIKDSGKPLEKTFKPFVNNPSKQARYERYLENKDSVLERGGDMDKLEEWERERELVEFEQAAKLYRPLTGVMGDRFTHASQPDEALNPLCAVAKSSTNHGLATPDQIAAALKGAYGVMTRSVTSWRPESMVSKRFNVPEIGGARSEQKKEDKPKISYSVFSYLESSVHDKDSFAKEQSKFSGSKSIPSSLSKPDHKPSRWDQREKTDHKEIADQKDPTKMDVEETGFAKRMTVAELFLKESEESKETGKEVTETINKFDKMDLYKSIFLSDSEDDDIPGLESKNNDPNDGTDFLEKPKNVERNNSPPRGIFANIDFDEINSWRRKDESKAEKNTETNKNTEASKLHKNTNTETSNPTINEEGVYGPKIPEKLQSKLENDPQNTSKDAIEIESSSEASWVDVNELKGKKHKKKKNKKHKHKKKSKSKKKDR